MSIYRELDDPRGLADALEEIGMALFGSGRFDEAPRALTEARERNVALGNRQKAAECTLALGVLALAQGMADEAHDRFTEAHAAFADLGDWYWIAFAERLLGGAARLRGDIGAAAAHYATSLALSRRHDLPVLTAGALYSFAELALAGGDHERALRLMGASEVIRDRVGAAPAGEVAMMGDVRGAAAAFFDEPTSQRLFRQGREMDLDAAVAYALEDRRDL